MYEQLDIFSSIKQPYKITKPIRLIELFAGVGSQAMALKRLGANFEHYRVVEFEKYAIKSYNAIHGTDFEPMDITKIIGSDLGISDTDKYCYIMTYSFPCQDLSVAGKQKGMTKGSGTRSGLLWEVERLLNEVENLPQVLLMENVPQVHGKKNMEDFQRWIDFLESKGYSNYWQDLNAKNYGVAQNRNRCFMVSILGDYSFKFPEPIELKKVMKDYLEDEVDEKTKNYFGNKYLKTGTLNKAFEMSMAKLDGEISLCLTARSYASANTQYVTRKNGTRTIVSGKEVFRLMDFSDEDFEKAAEVNSNTQLYKQAGNSIVVNVLVAILGQLFPGKENIYKELSE